MADGSGSAAFMNMSDSAHNGAKMEIDGFPPNTLYSVTIGQSNETKQWLLPSNTISGSVDQAIGVQPPAGVANYFPDENTPLLENGSAPVQQDDLCTQDDLFSLDELASVGGQGETEVLETTIETADIVTSLSGDAYEPYLSGGEIDGTRCVPGERSEMGLNETGKQDISSKIISGYVDCAGQQTNRHLLDKGKKEDLEGMATLNSSSINIDKNACPGQELTGTFTLEGHTNEIMQFEDNVETDVHSPKESGEIDDDQPTSEFLDKARFLTENNLHTEPLTAAANQLNQAPEEVKVSIEKVSQNEKVKYHTDQLTSELPDDENKLQKHLTNDSGVCCSKDLPKEVNCQSDQKQSQMTILNEQMSVTDEKHLEPSALKSEESTQLEQVEIVASKGEQESQFTQEIEMSLVKEEKILNNKQPANISNAMQTELGTDQHAKSEDANQIPTFEKLEISIAMQTALGTDQQAKSEDANQILTFEKLLESQERQMCIDSSAETNEPSANVTQKGDNVSMDPNPPHEEQSKNVQQIENAIEDMSNMASHMPIFQGTIESPVEHIEHKDDEQKQLELLKGRKVAKRFGKRKYMGEVIGYDPASKWYKVLYEDGDEEELEKHEVDAILILHGEDASVSRKRQLSPTNLDHDESNRSEKKSRKVDKDGAPGRQRKTKILKDETPGSSQLSNTKKRKSTAAKSRGKSKSPKTDVRRGQKGSGKSTSTKKSTGKKTSAKKSQFSQTKGQQKSHLKEKSSKHEGKQDSADEHANEVTRKLKYGSSKKKIPTKAKQKAKEIPKKGKEAEMSVLLMATKPEMDTPGRKRKAVSELQSDSATASHKHTKRAKVVNDVESIREKKTELTMVSEDAHEFPSQAEGDKPQTAVPLSTGKKRGRGTDLIGRKVKKDFGRKLYGGEVVGYEVFYNVKYEDGDSEDLTWKELEPILLPEEHSVVQDKSSEQHQITKQSSARSKGKKKT